MRIRILASINECDRVVYGQKVNFLNKPQPSSIRRSHKAALIVANNEGVHADRAIGVIPDSPKATEISERI